jgi:hypothetical protein
VGLDATGIEVFVCIPHTKLHIAISLQRGLISKLEALNISQVSGENIPSFNIQVQELCESIEQAGPPPADLNKVVMKCFLHLQVTLFANTIEQKYLELEMDPQRHQWRAILQDNEDLYLKLKKMWTLESSKPVNNKEFQSFVKTTENRLNQLKIKGADKKGPPMKPDSNKPIKCFDCRKPRVRMGCEGCKQKGKSQEF